MPTLSAWWEEKPGEPGSGTIAPGGAMKGVVSVAAVAVLSCTGIASNLDTTLTNNLSHPYRAIPLGEIARRACLGGAERALRG